MPFVLIIGGASKQHKRMLQINKALGGFLVMVHVHSFRNLPKFPVDPYYEPLV